MAIEEQRLRIRRTLEEKLGVEEASYLMDRPAGGWSDLVTNHTLDLKFSVIDERFRAVDERFRTVDERFHALEAKIDTLRHELRAEMERGFRRQTWSLMTVSITGFTAMFAALVALMTMQ